MSIEVEHIASRQRFELKTSSGVSYLSYVLNNGAVNFDHTFVIPADRGGRVGHNLVNAALTWADGKAYTMEASCWYVARYLEKRRS